jgi:hypothetical protein
MSYKFWYLHCISPFCSHDLPSNGPTTKNLRSGQHDGASEDGSLCTQHPAQWREDAGVAGFLFGKPLEKLGMFVGWI